jgi:hypothetical protein
MSMEPVITPKLVPGAFVYTGDNGQSQTMYFQFNPEKLARSRTAQFTETKANDTQGTTSNRGTQGKKYTLKVERWKIDLDIRLDASKPTFISQQTSSADPLPLKEGLEQVKKGLEHLEAMIEPGPIPSENDSLYGYQTLPDPPMVQFLWGDRGWAGFLTSLSISEILFTRDLKPRRVEATVSMVILETLRQLEQGKTGGKQ